MIVGSSIFALLHLLGGAALGRVAPAIPGWAFPVLGLLGLFNLACAIALLSWKKWGFWGLLASSIVTFILNISIGVGPGSSILGLVGIAALYGVLHIGDKNKGWPQLD
jgi:hypothetical protein